jgi:hypothetical protein
VSPAVLPPRGRPSMLVGPLEAWPRYLDEPRPSGSVGLPVPGGPAPEECKRTDWDANRVRTRLACCIPRRSGSSSCDCRSGYCGRGRRADRSPRRCGCYARCARVPSCSRPCIRIRAMILLCSGLHILGSLLTTRLQRVGLLLAAALRVLPVIHAVCLGCRCILLPARLEAVTSLRPCARSKAAGRGGTFTGEIAT